MIFMKMFIYLEQTSHETMLNWVPQPTTQIVLTLATKQHIDC